MKRKAKRKAKPRHQIEAMFEDIYHTYTALLDNMGEFWPEKIEIMARRCQVADWWDLDLYQDIYECNIKNELIDYLETKGDV